MSKSTETTGHRAVHPSNGSTEPCSSAQQYFGVQQHCSQRPLPTLPPIPTQCSLQASPSSAPRLVSVRILRALHKHCMCSALSASLRRADLAPAERLELHTHKLKCLDPFQSALLGICLSAWHCTANICFCSARISAF